VDLHNTLWANNILLSNVNEKLFTASTATAPITSPGYNLSDDASANTFLTATRDMSNAANALLSTTLQYNGGPNPTFTYALLPHSPALGKGDPTDGSTLDQRGLPSGFPHSNIGAFQAWVSQSGTAPSLRLTNTFSPGFRGTASSWP
jgi:hypothetical protein